MVLRVAQTAGFCMGVDLALRKLDSAVAAPPVSGSIYTLGPIIHNPQVLEKYAEQGVVQADAASRLQAADVVVIRAHGIPRELQEDYEAMGATIIDATCPKVKKAQILIQRQAEAGKVLLLFGEKDHPEVRGLVSYARDYIIFESPEELRTHPLDPTRTYFLAAQTTQDRSTFEVISEHLLRSVDRDLVILDTICNATKDRQDEVRMLAQEVDAMIIVGGRNSGNTRRLAQIASETGIFTIHVETAEELPLRDLRAFERIGLTAGASTPAWIIQSVAETLTTDRNSELGG